MMKSLKRFSRTCDIVMSDCSNHDKEQSIRMINNGVVDKPSVFQKVLDFLGQPVYDGAPSMNEARAHSVLVNGYWNSIAERDGRLSGNNNQNHLHIHVDDVSALRDFNENI